MDKFWLERKCSNLSKSSKLDVNVNTVFISTFTFKLTPDSDVALNKRTAGQVSLYTIVFSVWFCSCNGSMSLAVTKKKVYD